MVRLKPFRNILSPVDVLFICWCCVVVVVVVVRFSRRTPALGGCRRKAARNKSVFCAVALDLREVTSNCAAILLYWPSIALVPFSGWHFLFYFLLSWNIFFLLLEPTGCVFVRAGLSWLCAQRKMSSTTCTVLEMYFACYSRYRATIICSRTL